MYGLNTAIRTLRFLSQTLVGIGLGFVGGYLAGKGDISISGLLQGIGL